MNIHSLPVVVALVFSLTACPSGEPRGAAGHGGSAMGASGSSGAAGGPPHVCPTWDADLRCPMGSPALVCNLQTSARLLTSGDNLYLYNGQTLFRLDSDLPTKLLDGITSTGLGAGVLLDDGYVYYFKEKSFPRVDLVRQRLDGTGAPEIVWGCASSILDGLLGNLAADATSVFFQTSAGIYQVDKASVPGSKVTWLGASPAEHEWIGVDAEHLYLTLEDGGLYTTAKTANCACNCDAPVPVDAGAGAKNADTGLYCGQEEPGKGGVGDAAVVPGPNACGESQRQKLIAPPRGYDSVRSVLLDASSIWFSDSEGTYRASKDGSAVVKLTGKSSPNPSVGVGPLAQDEAYVYMLVKVGADSQLLRLDKATDALDRVASVPYAGLAISLVVIEDAAYALFWTPLPEDPRSSCASELRRFAVAP